MVNTNQGVDPSIARQFHPSFNASQLQGGGNAFNLGGRSGMLDNPGALSLISGAGKERSMLQ